MPNQLVRKDGTPDRRANSPTKHSEETRIAAFTRAAFVGPTQAAKDLGLPRDTVSRWCYDEKHRAEYFKIREQAIQDRKAYEAEQNFEAASRARELSEKVKDRFEQDYDKLEPRDLSTASRNFTVEAGIYTDKAKDLRGDAQVIVTEHRDIAEIIRALEAKGVRLPDDMSAAAKPIEGDAEDVTDETASADNGNG